MFKSVVDKNSEIVKIPEDNTLNDMKSKFIAIISHELRTPLAAISSSMEIIEIVDQQQNASSNSKISEHISKASIHLSHMKDLLIDLLLVNDIENGSLNMHPSTFSINELIHEL